MQKLTLILILLLSLLSLYAQESIDAMQDEPEVIYDENLVDGSPIRLSLMQAEEYHLNLTISPGLGVIFAKLEFEITKSQLQTTDYYSFFLTKAAYIEKFRINGVNTPFNITSDLHPKHFVPDLCQPVLLDSCTTVTCYSIESKILAELPEKINFCLEYRLPLPEWKTHEDGREFIAFSGCNFWYPRNLSQSSELNLSVLTTVFYTMDGATITDTGHIRKLQKSYIDIPGEIVPFQLYKMLN